MTTTLPDNAVYLLASTALSDTPPGHHAVVWIAAVSLRALGTRCSDISGRARDTHRSASGRATGVSSSGSCHPKNPTTSIAVAAHDDSCDGGPEHGGSSDVRESDGNRLPTIESREKRRRKAAGRGEQRAPAAASRAVRTRWPCSDRPAAWWEPVWSPAAARGDLCGALLPRAATHTTYLRVSYGSVIHKWPSHAVPPTMMARPGKLPPQLPVGKVGAE